MIARVLRLVRGGGEKARQQQRAYQAAKYSRLRSGWLATPLPPDADILRDAQALIARSRDAYQNNPWARRFVQLVADHVVGPDGVRVVSQARDPDGTPDVAAQQAIEAAWRDWADTPACDLSGKRVLAEMLRAIVRTVVIDGEALVRLHERPEGLRLETLDPMLLDRRLNRVLGGGRRIVMGVELDADGRPVAYHLLRPTAIPAQGGYAFPADYVRVPADEILHLYVHEYAAQTRGVPWMAAALVRMRDLEAYDEAAVTAARIGAAKMGFIRTPEEGAPMAEEEDAAGEPMISVEPGVIEELPPGAEFAGWDPSYPHQQYPHFVRTQLMAIAAALGVSYISLTGDMEAVNYSSARVALLEERDRWRALQRWLIDHLVRPVFRRWLRLEIVAGRITVAGKPLRAERLSKYERAAFLPRRWQWVDPLKEIQAAKVAVELGVASRAEIIRDRGRDPDEVMAEIAREEGRNAGQG